MASRKECAQKISCKVGLEMMAYILPTEKRTAERDSQDRWREACDMMQEDDSI